MPALMQTVLWVAGALFIYMTAWFFVSVAQRRADVVDQAWGLGFVLVALVNGFVNGWTPPYLILVALVSVWGFRLFWHINRRHAKTGEDPRYTEIEAKGGGGLVKRWITIYLLQGGLILVVSAPITAFGSFQGAAESTITANVIAGLLIWIVGFIFESVGDKQLADFLADPANKGQIMDRGLWHYTRHPNYFGELTMWWGIWVLTFSSANLVPWLVSAIGPGTLTYLIVFVSGIPPIEKQFMQREDFRAYAARTSVLIPWFPKK